MITERTTYKNCPMITLKKSEDDKYPFSFGVNKAKMIVECLEDIKKFISDVEKPIETSGDSSNKSTEDVPF